ncbi:MAG: glycosyltransferase [Okeania sp. SIO2F4]|uniref:glycosyltransferase family 2 protein n=1 Tax=Okeania sp. SIO2F4 TaxID=2607790 RepID=UPI00142C878F|nr:glycosyltransferase family 2 protein [Okeania sp. SIO2F4]NES05175.1 glycosyltransferase [Okeania sp. SIO2F4]
MIQNPSLEELPQPPEDKQGWPWTETTPKLSDKMPDGNDWPKISIVTPSYNQGKYLEETIRSVLLQGYPHLEYIIIDGGSTDNSVEIIEKYSPWLSYWVSEKDQGQSNGINKGFKQVTGDIVAWINSDDYYFQEAFAKVAQEINPEKKRFVIVGKAFLSNIENYHGLSPVFSPYNLLFHNYSGKMGLPIVMPPQPAIFWHKQVLEKTGFLDENLDKSLDYEYWLRMMLSHNYKFYSIPMNFAYYRIHPESKSGQGWQTFAKEYQLVFSKYWDSLNFFHKFYARMYWLITSYLFIFALKCKNNLRFLKLN